MPKTILRPLLTWLKMNPMPDDLTPELIEVLKLLSQWDNDPDVSYAIYHGRLRSRKVNPNWLQRDIQALKERGYIEITTNDSADMLITLTPEAQYIATHSTRIKLRDLLRDYNQYLVAILSALLSAIATVSIAKLIG